MRAVSMSVPATIMYTTDGVRRGKARQRGYKAGNGNVSRAASNQQFTRTSRGCDRLGVSRAFWEGDCLLPVLGPSCDGFRTTQGVVLDWPVVWGEIKMAARQPVACRTPPGSPTRASSCRWLQACAESKTRTRSLSYPRTRLLMADRQAINRNGQPLCDSQPAPPVESRPARTGMWRLLPNLLFP
jgi:hypothetical protein